MLVKELFKLTEKIKKSVALTSSPLHKIYDFTVPLDWQIISLKPRYWKLTGSFIENLIQKHHQPEKLIWELKKTNLNEYFQQKGVKDNDVIIINNQEFFWHYE